MRRTLIVLGILVPLGGCSGSSDSGLNGGAGGAAGGGSSAYEPMFTAPGASATSDSLYGVWGGSEERGGVRFDVRMRIAAGRLTLASRCMWKDGTTLIVGTSGAARVAPKEDDFGCFAPKGGLKKATCGSIAVLESKTEKTTAGEKFCSVEMKPLTYEYSLAGTDLRLSLSAESLEFVKISD
jgi:hypothetical protein